MNGFDADMQRALEADGEKLRQLTGEDHGPAFLADGLLLTPEARSRLARLAHDLSEHSDAIRKGIQQHGSYNVPWNVLSWGKDMTALGSEAIEGIIGTLCRQCGGTGIIDNPEAVYTRDWDTGSYETNDPEEVECPHCDGTGLEPPVPDADRAADTTEIQF